MPMIRPHRKQFLIPALLPRIQFIQNRVHHRRHIRAAFQVIILKKTPIRLALHVTEMDEVHAMRYPSKQHGSNR